MRVLHHLVFVGIFCGLFGLVLPSLAEKSPKLESAGSLAELPKPIFVDPDGGKTWNIFGLKIVGKVMSEETRGQYSVIVSTTPPGGGPPKHVHLHEDEMFYVLEGTFEFSCGDHTETAEKGAIVVLPRGIPHTFRNVGESPGLLMNTITPGGFEGFFEDVDQLPKDQPLDRGKVEEIAARYGLTFIKPSAN